MMPVFVCDRIRSLECLMYGGPSVFRDGSRALKVPGIGVRVVRCARAPRMGGVDAGHQPGTAD